MRHQRKWGCNLDLFYSGNPLFVIGDHVNKSSEKNKLYE
jgi:tRNA pseudouridine-54 N-methylase